MAKKKDKDNPTVVPSSAIDFEKDADDCMQPRHPEKKTTMQHVCFVNDPGAEAVEEKLNTFSEDFFNSFYDPLHPFHKWIPISEKVKYFALIISHQELKLKHAFARDKYYNPNPEGIEGPYTRQGFAGEAIPIFE